MEIHVTLGKWFPTPANKPKSHWPLSLLRFCAATCTDKTGNAPARTHLPRGHLRLGVPFPAWGLRVSFSKDSSGRFCCSDCQRPGVKVAGRGSSSACPLPAMVQKKKANGTGPGTLPTPHAPENGPGEGQGVQRRQGTPSKRCLPLQGDTFLGKIIRIVVNRR